MGKTHSGHAIMVSLLLLLWSLVPLASAPAQVVEGSASSPGADPGTQFSGKNPPLAVDVVVRNLQRRNAQRAAALEEFAGTRVYRMQYRGMPGDRDAEMVVSMKFHAPAEKHFDVVSEQGSKFIIDHVFKKLLEGEQEAASEENRRRSALSSENYEFSLAGYDDTAEGGRYVLDLLPRTRNKFLYRGKIWVDAKDFAVVRIAGEPGKNPSFWIKNTAIEHDYIKLNDFWLPAENHTESVTRLGGKATLTIEYKDYKITQATPLPELQSARDQTNTSQNYGIH
jgi:hypothetical protein